MGKKSPKTKQQKNPMELIHPNNILESHYHLWTKDARPLINILF